MPPRSSDPAAPALGVLDWDSDFFACRIGRLRDPTLTTAGARATVDWAERESVDCVYFLADAGDPASAHAAEAVGFRLMDVRLTLSWTAGRVEFDLPASPVFDLAGSADLPDLRAIARTSHADSRFYADPHFSRERCDAFYERWIEGSCGGDADAVLVQRLEGRAVAYVSCHLSGEGSGHIGLVAVADAARGRSIGAELLRDALAWFSKNGASTVDVVTQGRNTRATRHYERAGFSVRSVGLWFHRWTADATGPGARS